MVGRLCRCASDAGQELGMDCIISCGIGKVGAGGTTGPGTGIETAGLAIFGTGIASGTITGMVGKWDGES